MYNVSNEIHYTFRHCTNCAAITRIKELDLKQHCANCVDVKKDKKTLTCPCGKTFSRRYTCIDCVNFKPCEHGVKWRRNCNVCFYGLQPPSYINPKK